MMFTAPATSLFDHHPRRNALNKPGRAVGPRTGVEWQSTTAESTALSKTLRRAGFRFVGPTTAYAAMQACGVVNDHIAECWVRQAVEDERTAALAT